MFDNLNNLRKCFVEYFAKNDFKLETQPILKSTLVECSYRLLTDENLSIFVNSDSNKYEIITNTDDGWKTHAVLTVDTMFDFLMEYLGRDKDAKKCFCKWTAEKIYACNQREFLDVTDDLGKAVVLLANAQKVNITFEQVLENDLPCVDVTVSFNGVSLCHHFSVCDFCKVMLDHCCGMSLTGPHYRTKK